MLWTVRFWQTLYVITERYRFLERHRFIWKMCYYTRIVVKLFSMAKNFVGFDVGMSERALLFQKYRIYVNTLSEMIAMDSAMVR